VPSKRPKYWCDVVLPLALGEVDHGHALFLGEAVDGRHEGPGDGLEHDRRGHPVATVLAEETDYALGKLQLGDIDVQVHPVDALDLERDVPGQHVRHRAR
jgi:hypothetical protein